MPRDPGNVSILKVSKKGKDPKGEHVGTQCGGKERDGESMKYEISSLDFVLSLAKFSRFPFKQENRWNEGNKYLWFCFFLTFMSLKPDHLCGVCFFLFFLKDLSQRLSQKSSPFGSTNKL